MLGEDDVIAHQRIGLVLGGQWKLEQLLGSGGMAAVYRARALDGRVAAVKLLHPEMALQRDVRERFLREGYAANRVEHPGAVAVLEHGGGGGEPTYLVMELLEGCTLSARYRSSGGLPLVELLGVLEQVLEVLVCAHDRGIVHRDLKPDNLFITTSGQVKILDFGLARIADGTPGGYRTRTGVALGTLPYMAPEQAKGVTRDLDGRADLFSLGATAFRILAGRRVHEAESDAELLMAMATKPAPRLATVAPGVPAEVCAVVDLALAFAREARYPDARTMLGDVRALRAQARPPYVTQDPVVRGRDEPTRAERAAPLLPSESPRVEKAGAQPTVLAPVVAESPRSGRTVPLPAFAATAPSPPPPLAAPSLPSNAPARPATVKIPVLAVLMAAALSVLAAAGGSIWLLRALTRSVSPLPTLSSSSAEVAPAASADGPRGQPTAIEPAPETPALGHRARGRVPAPTATAPRVPDPALSPSTLPAPTVLSSPIAPSPVLTGSPTKGPSTSVQPSPAAGPPPPSSPPAESGPGQAKKRGKKGRGKGAK